MLFLKGPKAQERFVPKITGSPQAMISVSISIVNQFDAARLGVEMSAMLKEQLVQVFSLTMPRLLFQYELGLCFPRVPHLVFLLHGCTDRKIGDSDVKFVMPRLTFSKVLNHTMASRAKGLIFAQYTENLLYSLAECDGILACVLVDFEIARRIAFYSTSTRNPVIKVSPAITVVGEGVLSPRVAAFSSRGPSATFPAILKPDVAAPGVSILAAEGNSYVFMSGTSMACPHVSAVTALLKSVHPDWSPAMIKSAIVTTASVIDHFSAPIEADGIPRKLADPFDFGGGHMDPDMAMDPGLVYDIDGRQYTKFLNCTIRQFDNCGTYMGELYLLNLPSIAVPDLKDSITVRRTVTNVGPVEATYRAVVEAPTGVTVSVEPSVITFTRDTGRSVVFKVRLTAKRRVQGGYTFGSLTWLDDNTHSVRVPIATRIVIQDMMAVSDVS